MTNDTRTRKVLVAAAAFLLAGMLTADSAQAQMRRRVVRPRNVPVVGHVVRTLPRGYVRLSVGGFPYFYYGGVFYHHRPSGYEVVGAPAGSTISSVPEEATLITVGSNTYSYFEGAFYIWDPDEDAYVVVEPPVGAEVPYVPDGYAVDDRDGILYYVYGDVWFRPVMRDGVTVYMVTRF